MTSLRKLFLSVLALISLTLLISCNPTKTLSEASPNTYTDISVQEAFTMIQDNQGNVDFIILDVRTPEEYQTGHIADAVNIDFNAEDFENNLNNLSIEKTYLVYCRTGGRSQQASEKMISLSFQDVYNMLGGITAWVNAGYETVQ